MFTTQGLLYQLENNERVEGDNGYLPKDPHVCKTPYSILFIRKKCNEKKGKNVLFSKEYFLVPLLCSPN